MHKKAFLPVGCVIALIPSMCQESDSSRQARGEPGLCSRGTKAQEAMDSHSSRSASITEKMGKHSDAGEEEKMIKLQMSLNPFCGELRQCLHFKMMLCGLCTMGKQ